MAPQADDQCLLGMHTDGSSIEAHGASALANSVEELDLVEDVCHSHQVDALWPVVWELVSRAGPGECGSAEEAYV
jgi:hypothetical protein